MPETSPALLTGWEEYCMCELKIRKIWELSYEDYCTNGFFHSAVQKNAARAILNCKSGKLGVNLNRCSECGHVEFHNNSCRNRNCPNCQAVLKEIWGGINAGLRSLTRLISMWYLLFLMN